MMDWFEGLADCCKPTKKTFDGSGGGAPGHASVATVSSGGEHSSTDSRASRGNRAGVGVILAMSQEGHLYVHTVCPGSSSEKQLIPGDVLLKVGGRDVVEMHPSNVAELLLGAPGTEVEVVVRRAEGREAIKVRLVRKKTDANTARKAIREAFAAQGGGA